LRKKCERFDPLNGSRCRFGVTCRRRQFGAGVGRLEAVLGLLLIAHLGLVIAFGATPEIRYPFLIMRVIPAKPPAPGDRTIYLSGQLLSGRLFYGYGRPRRSGR
jgi:hypothetical protein